MTAALQPDVIVLQEVYTPDAGQSEVAAFCERNAFHREEHIFGRGLVDPWPQIRPSGDGTGTIGIAILSPHQIGESRTLRLPAAPFDPVVGRAALEVSIAMGEHALQVIGLHTTSRLPIGPPKQLRGLARYLPGPELPTVVVGDHNFWGPAVRACLPAWKRTVRGRTWPASRPHSQIDHILIHRHGPLRLRAAGVLDSVGSDHLPVFATLEQR